MKTKNTLNCSLLVGGFCLLTGIAIGSTGNAIPEDLDPEDYLASARERILVLPVVFFYLRETEPGGERFSNLMERIISAANAKRAEEYGYPADEIDPLAENISIIEENNHWVVAFHLRGNDLAVAPDGDRYADFMDFSYKGRRTNLYYLSKGSLELIEPPDGSIQEAPINGVHYALGIRWHGGQDLPEGCFVPYQDVIPGPPISTKGESPD